MRNRNMTSRFALFSCLALSSIISGPTSSVFAAVPTLFPSPVGGPASVGLSSVQGKSNDQVETALSILNDLDRLAADHHGAFALLGSGFVAGLRLGCGNGQHRRDDGNCKNL